MRLCEHDDFQAAVTATSQAIDVPEPFVEKDYYITEILRILSAEYGDKVIFKGGTSLSKAWNLIRRLSEDIDLLVVAEKFEPRLGQKRAAGELERMRDLISDHPALTHHVHEAEKFSGGKTRRDPFGYEPRFGLTGFAPTVIAEPGVAEGTWPADGQKIESQVARYLRDQGSGELADDTDSFLVNTLHFRRTFIEKLFVVHALVERLKREGKPLDRDARHYYDLHALAGEQEVRKMLASDECLQIKQDCERVSLKFFASTYTAPPELSFAESDGLFPPADLVMQIKPDYDEQCGLLCFGEVPEFETVVGRLEELRPLL